MNEARTNRPEEAEELMVCERCGHEVLVAEADLAAAKQGQKTHHCADGVEGILR